MFSPNYMELDFAVPIIQRGSGEDTRYVPSLPDLSFGLVLCFVDGVNYYAYPLPASTLGKQCLAHVVYQAKDDAILQVHPGKLGKGNEVCKLTAYKEIVQKTVAEKYIEEEKEKLTKEAEAKGEEVKQEDLDKVKYEEADKDDGYPILVFLEKDYVDK